MKKTIILLALLSSSIALSNTCPDIVGQYSRCSGDEVEVVISKSVSGKGIASYDFAVGEEGLGEMVYTSVIDGQPHVMVSLDGMSLDGVSKCEDEKMITEYSVEMMGQQANLKRTVSISDPILKVEISSEQETTPHIAFYCKK